MSESWTLVDVPDDNEKSDRNARLLESLVRVTFAGFAGACIGLSYGNKASTAKIFQRAVVVTTKNNNTKKQRPPGAITSPVAKGGGIAAKKVPARLKTVQQLDETNYPLMWATSFMCFVSILETSRFWSPTSLLMQSYCDDDSSSDRTSVLQLEAEEEENDNDTDGGNLKDNNLLEKPNKWADQYLEQYTGGTGTGTGTCTQPLITIMDFTLGGAVAGLAGGFAKQRPPPTSSSTNPLQLPSSILKSGRRSLVLSSIGTGIVLGFLAGVGQAGLDVAETLALQEEAKQQQIEAEREREMFLQEAHAAAQAAMAQAQTVEKEQEK